jgi:hypothetical protein
VVRFPLVLAGAAFRVQIMLAELRLAGGTRMADAEWDMAIVAGDVRPLLSLAEELSGAVWRAGGCDVALRRTPEGGGRLLERELALRRVAFEAWPARTTLSRD